MALLLAFVATSDGAWAAEVTIAEGRGGAANIPRQPQLAIDGDGTVHVAYGAGDAVYHSLSTDGAQTFSPPVRAFTCPNMSLGMRRGPRVALSGAAAVVTAIGGPQGKGRDGDIRSWSRQPDGTWLEGPRVNDVESSAREGLHGMAAGPDGTLWCVWLDLRDRKTEIYAARSRDAGRSWEKNILAYRSPEGSVCECCHPSVAVDDQQQVHVLFRNSLKGARDMFLVSSRDGQSFDGASPVARRLWTLKACPMDGGMLAVDRDRAAWAVYRREKQVFLATGVRETLLGPGEQPTIAITKTGPAILWTAGRVGDLMQWSSGSAPPKRLAANARDPAIATNRSGELAVAVWEEVQGDTIRIRATSLPMP